MRPRKKDKHLPRCVYLRHGAYWRVTAGKWTRLGTTPPKVESVTKRSELSDLIDTVMDQIRPTLAKNTIGNYKTACNKIKHGFQDFTPQQIKPVHIWAFRDLNAATPGMTNRCLSLLKQIFNYAVRREIVEINPVLGVELHEEKKRDRLISAAEFDAIYAKAGDRLQCIMDLWYLTGQRVRDVMLIHRADINDEGIYFKQQKTKKKLLVRWTPEMRAVVERAKSLSDIPTLTLFQSRYRKPLDYRSVHLQWTVACEAAGVTDAQMRDVRAMSGTDADEQGLDPSALLGHEDKQTTRRYLRGKKISKVDGPTR